VYIQTSYRSHKCLVKFYSCNGQSQHVSKYILCYFLVATPNQSTKLVWKRRQQLPAHNKMAASVNIDETSCEIVDLRKCNFRVSECLHCVGLEENLLIALEEVESTKLIITLEK